jgi:hypothetical protein
VNSREYERAYERNLHESDLTEFNRLHGLCKAEVDKLCRFADIDEKVSAGHPWLDRTCLIICCVHMNRAQGFLSDVRKSRPLSKRERLRMAIFVLVELLGYCFVFCSTPRFCCYLFSGLLLVGQGEARSQGYREKFEVLEQVA